jgi:hypothetical protein
MSGVKSNIAKPFLTLYLCQHICLTQLSMLVDTQCKPRAPYMVTWIIRQPISPQLHVYKPTSQTSRSSEGYTLLHTLSPAPNCLQKD